MLFSVLVMRADFKDTALSCLLSDWSLDNEGVFSLTTATGVGDISELPVNRQRFGSVNMPWCRVQLSLLPPAAVWSDIDCLAYGRRKSFHRRSRQEEILRVDTGMETIPWEEAWTSTFICQGELWALPPCCPLCGLQAATVSLSPRAGNSALGQEGSVCGGWMFFPRSFHSQRRMAASYRG